MGNERRIYSKQQAIESVKGHMAFEETVMDVYDHLRYEQGWSGIIDRGGRLYSDCSRLRSAEAIALKRIYSIKCKNDVANMVGMAMADMEHVKSRIEVFAEDY